MAVVQHHGQKQQIPYKFPCQQGIAGTNINPARQDIY